MESSDSVFSEFGTHSSSIYYILFVRSRPCRYIYIVSERGRNHGKAKKMAARKRLVKIFKLKSHLNIEVSFWLPFFCRHLQATAVLGWFSGLGIWLKSLAHTHRVIFIYFSLNFQFY